MLYPTMRKNLIDFNSPKLQEDVANCDRIITPFAKTDISNYSDILAFNKQGEPYIANYQRVREYLDDRGYIKEIISENPLVKRYYYFDLKTGYYQEISEESMYEKFIQELCSIASDLRITRNTKAEFLANVLPFIRDCNDLQQSESFDLLKDLYTDGEVMPFKNGVYSLRTNRLLPRTSCIFIKNHFKVNFNPASFNSPIGQRYFEITDENEELFEYLFEQIGYAMYCETFFIPTYTVMYGPGSNGKSMFVNAIRSIMGDDLLSGVTLEGMANPFEVAYSEGKRVNLVADASAGYFDNKFAPVTLVPSFMKQCSSGEKWQFNPKHKSLHWGYGPSKFIFATNVCLNFSDSSDGTVRRTKPVFLPRVFKEDRLLVKQMESQEAMEWFALQALVSFKNFINNAMKGKEDIPFTPLTGMYIHCEQGDDIKREMLAAKDVIADFLITEKELDILDVEEVRNNLDGVEDIYLELKEFCMATGRCCPHQRTVTRYFKDKYNLLNRRSSRMCGIDIVHYYILEKQ